MATILKKVADKFKQEVMRKTIKINSNKFNFENYTKISDKLVH